MEHKYFQEAAWNALLDTVCAKARAGDPDAAEDLDFLESHIRNLLDYIREIGISEVGIRLAPGRLEADELRARVEELDRSRTACHNAAISSTAFLNRIAAAYGGAPVYTGDPAQRRQVAAFCMEAVSYLFQHRR